MKKKLLLSMFLCVVMAQAQTNLLGNGGFETGNLTGWRFFEVPSNIGSSCVVSSSAKSGLYAAKMTLVTNNGTVTDRALDIFANRVAATPGSVYEFNSWLKSDNPTGFMVKLSISYFNATGGFISSVDMFRSVSTIYQKFTMQSLAPAAAASSSVQFRLVNNAQSPGSKAAGTLYVDDASIYKVETTSFNILNSLNGDFETGTADDWRFVDNASPNNLSSVNISSTDAHSGSYAARVNWAKAATTTEIAFDQYVSTNITPGVTYTYSAWAKSLSGPFILHISSAFINASGQVLSASNGVDITWILSTNYTNHSFVLPTAPVGTVKLNIGFRAYNADGSRWPATNVECLIDDVKLNYPLYGSSSTINISAGNHLTVDGNTSVNSIVLAPGAKLTLSSGNTLTASNGITLQSDANGTATMLNSGTYSGTVTAQQYLGSARNWYVSSPVASATSPANNVDYYYEYVEAGNNNPAGQPGSSTVYWKGLTNGTTMEVGKGYIAKTNAGATVQFSGTPNNGNITTAFNLTRDDAKGRGFNLVGNPYPSYIDWTAVAAANPNLDNTYIYRTRNSLNAYTFVTWNGAGSNYVVSNGSLAVNTTITRYIPPTQAFWVRVKSGTASTAMSFTNAMRAHRDDNGNLMKAPKQDTRTSIRLQLQNGTESDEVLIYQDAAASNDYDTYDSPKMMNNSTTVPDLYSKVNDERLVINGLNAITYNTELPLGFGLNAEAALKFKVSELNNLPEGTKLYLRDKQENSETELTPATEYAFSTTATTNNESRFSLLFKAPGVTTGTTNANSERISVFVNTRNQITIIAKPNSMYSIYNAVGQVIENGILKSELQTANCKLQTGVLVVKVNNQSTRVVVK